jgi:gliding motility-associated-like protein
MCNTGPLYPITVSPGGGNFITGITGTANPISSNGQLNPSVFSSYGVKTFTYSIAVNTCVATQTATYEVSQFFPATLTSSVPPLCVTNSPFNLMNIVQSTVNGSWSGTGVQGGGGSYQFNPANLNTGSYAITYSTFSSPNPTVCPAFSNLNVPVTKTITPFITPVPEFCTNSAQKNMTVNPSGGSWYNNSAVSSAGVISPTLAAIPASVAFYSVQIGPCVNTNTTVLNASKFNPAGFTGTVNNLCINSPAVNLMAIVQSTANGVWSGPGVTSNTFLASSLDPGPYASASGNYVLQYMTQSSPNLTLCPDSRTIAVNVADPIVPQISNAGPFCNNASAVQLTVVPSTGYWTTSSYLSGGGVFDPSLGSVGNNAVQYVVGSATCNVQQTKFISVEAFVSAKISSQLPDQCTTGAPVSLVPLTVSSGGLWSGPGIAGSTFNPGLTGSGTFTITHSTSSSPSGLCPDQAEMAVNVYSLATPVISKKGPFCNSSLPVQLDVTPVGGLFGGSNVGIVTLGGKFNPASAAIGDNLVNYSITSGPCVAYAQATIVVEKFISAAFDKSVSPICLIPGKTAQINLEAYVQNPGGTWDGDGVIPRTSMFDPFTATKGKNNTVTYYTHSMPTASLCPDQRSITIEVRDVPKVAAMSNSPAACAPAEIIFNTPTFPETAPGEGTWNFDDGSEPQTGFQVTHVYTTPGVYHATFSYKDDIGCEALPAKTSAITIHEKPKADFSFPDEILISNPDVQFTNLTTVLGDNTYKWTVINYTTTTEVNPVFNFQKIGRYQINLVATAPVGNCVDEITKTIEVKNDFNIFIPTSFSPNSDGLNDIFIPVYTDYGLDVKSFEMEIFDRWGHSLYRTKDITKGWDGSALGKGGNVNQGTYNYRLYD